MTSLNRRKSQTQTVWLLVFLKKYWLLILAFIFLLPPLIRYVRTMLAKDAENKINTDIQKSNAENGKADPVIIAKKTEVIKANYPNLKQTDLDRASTIAQGIANALGTNVEDNNFIFNTDFYNVNAWDEDEEKAVKLLKTVPGIFPVVADFYFKVHTRSRNLKTDIYELLSESDIDVVRATYKKYGKNWL